MTTESMQPQPELGPAAGSAPAQSQGHRRRRRRRKNKPSQPGAVQPQAQPQAQQPAPQPAPPAPPPPKAAQVQHREVRKKKKFFQKTQAPAQQPGNSMAASGQNKRRTRQKGPREFVGPMDHRYRATNGNVADGPPSTIPTGGNGRGAYYADSYVPQQAPVVREDAPTRIYCFIEDLFFAAKIQESARKLGIKVEFVKGADKEAIARLNDLPEATKQMLMVFDLNNLNAKPMSLIPKLKSRYKKAVSIIGFLHHLQGDLKMKALEAGCDTVMPRSAFSQALPVLLRRYGVEEEEDDHVRQPM
jgi:hypothetical protein